MRIRDPFEAMQGSRKKFADPFLVSSNEYFPDTLEDALEYAYFLWFLNPQYRMASKRVVSHFVTDIDFDGEDGDQDERDTHYDFLNDQLHIKDFMLELGDEWSAFGNAFARICFPFDRCLIDRRDGVINEYFLDMFDDADIKYDWKNLLYEVPDPRDMARGRSPRRVKLPFRDRNSLDVSRISVQKLDPRHITLQHSFMTKENQVVYRFDETFVRNIKSGIPWEVNTTPIAMLRAISKDQDFLFNKGEIYHVKAPQISGAANGGWGIPETICNYRSLHQLQVYRRIDEAVGLDYMLPFRMMTPNPPAGLSESAYKLGYAGFSHQMQEVIKKRRTDPTAMFAVPMPISFQEFGASGKQLTPKELLEYQTNDMLDGVGYPAELYRGTLSVQQMPTAIRIFENSFYFLHRHFDGVLRWASRRILDYLGREQIGVSLQLPSMAVDLEERQLYLSLAAGGEISRAKAYRAVGIDNPIQEAKERMQEDIEIQKEQLKLQQEFEREQTLGSADALLQQGGDPVAQGGQPAGAPVTPLDIMQEAEQKAVELLQIEDDGERSKVLAQIKATRPDFHAAVMEKMKQIRAQAASQGRKSVGQQLAQQ